MVKLIGGIGLSTVNIYDQIAAGDNVGSGCAHVHGIAEEAYLGLKGHGAIDLHDLKNGYRRVIITEGTFVQFPPWTMHRAVNLDNSQVLVIMGEDGLPEAGDMRIYFGEDIDRDEESYQLWAGKVKTREDALARRDKSSVAHTELVRLWEQDRNAYTSKLEAFFECHRRHIENTPDLSKFLQEGLPQSEYCQTGTWKYENPNRHFGLCGVRNPVDHLKPC
ncbi:cupin domain-containing protein [Parasalinivibrio latis]|uniref:cupin domain-containing protein n=1 Tax=Parasalinivibrio latis TaxID=2952610 RepID=UPI0030E12A6A